MNESNPPKPYLPVERAPAADLERQSRVFRSFQYLQEILDSCPYLAMVLNRHRQIVFFNRALLSLAGGGRPVMGLRIGEAMDCAHAWEGGGCGTLDVCRTCGAAQAVEAGLRGEAAVRECRITRDVEGRAEWLDLLVSISPVYVVEEEFLVCSIRDISAEKRREALENIFFHDILNSAAGVEFLAHTLEGLVEPGDASRFAEMIRACASQLVHEIVSQQQLLAAERDELAVSPACFDAAAFLAELIQRYESHPAARQRSIRVMPGCDELTMVTDRALLARVVENMLKNALEAAQPGETVTVGCRDGHPEIEFWVHNPGAMPREVRLQVFQRSFSTKGAGRGLGTYGMKLLTERFLKGKVGFRSDEQHGTTFYARCPRVLEDEAV